MGAAVRILGPRTGTRPGRHCGDGACPDPRGYGERVRILGKAVLAVAVLGATLAAAGALAERAFVKAREDGRM